MKRRPTEEDIDTEMVRIGWAKPYGWYWVGETEAQFRVRPNYTGNDDRKYEESEYRHMRERVRKELQSKLDREHAAEMGDIRHIETGTAKDVRVAVLQALQKEDRTFRSKAQASEVIRDRVNTILAERDFLPRAKRTIRNYVPDQYVKK